MLALAVTASAPAVSAGAEEETLPELAPLAVAPGGLDGLSGGASLVPESDGGGDAGDVAVGSSGPGSFVGAPTAPVDDLDGSAAELRELRARLVAEQARLTQQLLRLESGRGSAETRLDDAERAWTTRLAELVETDPALADLLLSVDDAVDPAARAAMVATLDATDRAIIAGRVAATAAVSRAEAPSEEVRAQLRAVSTRISAVDAAIAASGPATEYEQGRASGSVTPLDADYVFNTGPIPGIGYWGAVNSGSMLSGWMGFAGATVGGVNCSPPDPSMEATGAIETGEASWYGPGFHGNATANGEQYDQNAMTAAHPSLPFGTIVRVYSNVTARCAFVRINDRGPFVGGRIIDLSKAAADAIGMSGTASVQLEVWAAPAAPAS